MASISDPTSAENSHHQWLTPSASGLNDSKPHMASAQSSQRALPDAAANTAAETAAKTAIGAVVIGRNEGDFLADALAAVIKSLEKFNVNTGLAETKSIVYVDSGSTDDSVAIAKSLNIPVIELSTDQPFTAARAYNSGFQFLRKHLPSLQFVQFVDGDCIMDLSWISTAYNTLKSDPEISVVCGYIREKYRDQSPYNKLMDIDWQMPLGEVKECAGNTLMRAAHFEAVGGFDPKMMAGEEPELSLRLRRTGGKIVSIDAISVWHDARMVRFSQWWQRSRREGNAYAEAAFMHGLGSERHRVRESLNILFWGCILPLVTLFGTRYTHGWSLALLGLYGLSWVKITLNTYKKQNITIADAALYATFCLLSKFPRFLGQLNFIIHAIQRKTPKLIEYRLGTFGSAKSKQTF